MQIKRTSAALVAGLAFFMAGSAVAGEITISSDKLAFKGDLRLRHQTTEETDKTNRDRQRFRLRFGMDYEVTSQLAVKTLFASGTGEQTSTNQTLSNMSSQKQLWIDQAYLEFKPIELLKLYGGKMKNPLWQPYVSDAVWDTDLNPEGLAESVKLSFFGKGRVFVNALQMVVNERTATTPVASSSATAAQYVFSNQIGVILPAPMDSRLTLAGALHEWVNERNKTFNGPHNPNTNSKTNGNLSNDFRVADITAELYTTLFNMPLSIQGSYIKNLAARDDLYTSGDRNRDTGHQVGLMLGNASAPRSWEVAYFNKRLEQDSTVADANDSDFPATNRKGDIYWVAFAPWKNQQLKAKFFQTSIIEGAKKDINTMQFDWQVKF
ncbi:MAG: putative porin [Elusimicrobia bacterium]|nr:putative porin [Elusimicrobiota bacterium]